MSGVKEEYKIYTDEELSATYVGDAFKMYIIDMKQYPRLSDEETEELIKRNLNGDKLARELLVYSNLRLVLSIAKSYARKLTHMGLLDVVQEGNLGLIKAVDKYNPKLGKFSSYIASSISNTINLSIKNQEKSIRVPAHIESKINNYLKLISDYKKRNEPLPDKKTICKILGISEKTLEKVEHALNINITSTNEVFGSNQDKELEDFIPSNENGYESVLNAIDTQELLLILKEELSSYDYFIAYYRFITDNPLSQPEIASRLGITRARVDKKEKQIKEKIKPYLTENSKLYRRAKEKLLKKYSDKLNELSIEPLEPESIILYLYLKSYLTSLEQNILKEILFGKYKFNLYHFARKFNLSPNKIKEEINTISKIKNEVIDEKYEQIKLSVLQEYKTNILKINIDEVKINNYDYLIETYGNLTLEELKELYGERFNLLSKDTISLLEKFLNKPPFLMATVEELEREINLTAYNFKKRDTSLNKSTLYNTYLNNIVQFTPEQQLYLECFIFNKKDKNDFKLKYPNSKVRPNELKKKLEKLTFNIYNYFYSDLTKEQYLSVRNHYKDLITTKRITLLDLYFGINGYPKTFKEIAKTLKKTEDEIKRDIRHAKTFCLNIYINNKRTINKENKKIYAEYFKKYETTFNEEQQEILNDYLFLNKNSSEISKSLSISKSKVDNTIAETLRKIDLYRFNMEKPFTISKEELSLFYEYYKKEIDNTEKEIVDLKYNKNLENDKIAKLLNIPKEIVNKSIRHFNKLLNSFRIKNVVLTTDIIKKEINAHLIESIINDNEKEVLSLFYGIGSRYNFNEEKLSSKEICNKLKINMNQFKYLHDSAIKKIKLSLIGELKPDLIYISRNELNTILENHHLPISKQDKYIICSLLGLKNHELKRLSTLSIELNMQESHLKRKYQDAIINIYKYLNGEIKQEINYELDIIPNLKYFSKSDRLFIEEYYLNKLSYKSISKKYEISEDKVKSIFEKINVNIYELIHNPNCKKFDFEFYEQNKNNPNLPFYGDLKIATKAFDLMFESKLESPEIIECLNLNMSSKLLNEVIYNLMISMCKLKIGITKENTFTKEEAILYYNKNKSNMTPCHSRTYINYFNRVASNKTSTKSSVMNKEITYDLLKQRTPRYFKISSSSKEDVIELLKKYHDSFTKRIKYSLMSLFSISERVFMSGKEKRKVYKALNLIDTHIKMESEEKIRAIEEKKNDLESLSTYMQSLTSENSSSLTLKNSKLVG